ncbi:DUF4105 domain-containing protein [Pyxidicoccus trucidator]|uniref:lipoprotein N-acyltransferase Lnb domain-containing protein n=1 Tax=Pyxidicoccus trucidator TaxID=2709662 RepID=UPI0013DA5475|nr:DUF4105 domain-containing protein [Pyxidicoccus trucidator]
MARHAARILLIALLWSTAADATPPEGFGRHPEDLRMKVVTFGPGPDVHQFFGHSTLWVEDTRLGASMLYGYGMSSVGRGAALVFLLKRPTYWAGRVPLENAFFLYREQDRAIAVQELNLTVEQRRRLLARLEHDVRPAHREYQYHPIEDNCATRLRDALDEALGGALRGGFTTPSRLSAREHLLRHAQKSPVLGLVLDVWLNDTVDAPMTRWQESFVPTELSRLLADATLPDGAGGRVPLVGRRYDEHLSSAGAVPETPAPTRSAGFLIGAAFASVAVLLAALRGRGEPRWARVLFGLYHALFGLTLGSVGAVGLVLRFGSEHTALRPDVALLLVNPLTFALLPLGLALALGHRGAERLARGCVGVLVLGSLLAVALQFLPPSTRDDHGLLSLLLVANLGLGVAHGLRRHVASGAAAPSRARLQRA